MDVNYSQINFIYSAEYDAIMQIIWHGHSCFEFIDQNNDVLIDPHDGKSIGIKPPISNANIVLVSHNHSDHNVVRIVRGTHTDILGTLGFTSVNGITFEGLASYHDESEGSERGKNTIFKFKMDGISICHCGDLGDIPADDVMSKLTDIDILFVPVGEIFTIPLVKLNLFLNRVKPKVVVPMHYRVGGLTFPAKNLDEFIEGIDKDMLIYVGNEVELSVEDLTEFVGCWVFDR